MLKIHFFNVAGGDAILLEYEGADSPFRILVDAGRAILPESRGSLRHTAAFYLKKLDITYIDVLVITHLHVDHLQDLPEIMRSVRFGSMYSTYFPPDPSLRTAEVKSDRKAVRELPNDLNTLAECVMKAAETGTKMIPVTEDMDIPLDEKYGSIRIRMPLNSTLAFQNAVCTRLFRHDPVPEEEIYTASKSRNNNSLRLLAKYAGRTIALDGDYYACDAENEDQERCDILKVAHHGDRKSMTEKLASLLRPEYSVISCQREYDAKKDRPSKMTADWLRKYGSEVFYTDCFKESGQKVRHHEEVLILVGEDGSITVHGSKTAAPRLHR